MSRHTGSIRRMALTLIGLAVIGCAGSAHAQTQLTHAYGYDDAGRLLWANDGTTQISYSWDAGTNMLSRSVPEPTGGAAFGAALLALAALGRRRPPPD